MALDALTRHGCRRAMRGAGSPAVVSAYRAGCPASGRACDSSPARTAAASLARAERTVVPSRSARASAVAAPRPPSHCSMAVLPVAGVLVRLDIESSLSVLRDGRAAPPSGAARPWLLLARERAQREGAKPLAPRAR